MLITNYLYFSLYNSYILVITKKHYMFQNVFLLNLAASHLLMSIIGIIRGLGIINPKFIGVEDGEATSFCSIYAMMLFFVA